MNLVGKTTDEALAVGRGIREHANYDGHTPLVVMAEKYGREVDGTDVNVEGNDWVTYLEFPDQLRNLLARLTAKAAEGSQGSSMNRQRPLKRIPCGLLELDFTGTVVRYSPVSRGTRPACGGP